ncbi:hypothetical protein BGW36DRAFT_388972 [Talaromyces proteolyticus]|uniref:TauD/TfdA-like domain-containing protein n=1 Tax=Talaromyces proteolyticus TaxID=1131652 RepID=A0AAD4PVC3_9EURO|nr:uncharacterized protein BGW36DRAFT_388972 [Talaromyces proteolyticus]KAH8690563.1 hypothetical protein BGW36DRAFT_388972 [Talaromyces proteolyticus]
MSATETITLPFKARTARRLATETLPKDLPAGFPQELKSELVWEGAELEGKYNWTYELTASEVEEIEQGLAHFKSLNKPLGYITPETFPLPTLHRQLRSISHELHHGHGFKVLRGLPVHAHTKEENIIIYAGVSSHVAEIRGRQDRIVADDGSVVSDIVLNHIKDLSTRPEAQGRIGAPAYTTDKQVFHTDAGDIISLFALSEAAQGGTSRLASSWRVYNELAATRPDLIKTLAEDEWVFDGFGNKEKPYTTRPLLFHTAPTASAPERVLIQYARRSFTGYQSLPRSTDIPPITEAQAEALDALHFLAEKYAVGLDFRAGDVQYVNNLSIFHARDAFTDTPENQRHLLRLWLRDEENAWPTPDRLGDVWKRVYADVKPENQAFPEEPRIRSSSDGKAGQKGY